MGARARARKASAASRHAAESLESASQHAGGIITIAPLVVTEKREAGATGVADDLVHLDRCLTDLASTAVDAAGQAARGAAAADEVTDKMGEQAVREYLTFTGDAADQVRRTIESLQADVHSHKVTLTSHPNDGELWPIRGLFEIQVALSVADVSARISQTIARSELSKSRLRRSFERYTASQMPIALTYMVLVLACTLSLFWVPPRTVQTISMALVVMYAGTNGLAAVLTDRARLRVTVRVRSDTYGVVTIEHLDAVLDAIAENCFAATWVNIAIADAGPESPQIGIGLGADQSTLRFVENASSPRRIPVGTSPVPRGVGFDDGDTRVAMEPDAAIPVTDARDAVREFVKSERLPSNVDWQLVPSSDVITRAPQHRGGRRVR